MKKIISGLLIVFFLFLSVSVAEDIDLSGYSIEELELLIKRANEEIAAREGTEYWYDYGIGQFIPKIELISGKEPQLADLAINKDENMFIRIENTAEGDFVAYIEKLVAFGFDQDVERTNMTFEAKNGKGIHIKLTDWRSTKLSINADTYKVK